MLAFLLTTQLGKYLMGAAAIAVLIVGVYLFLKTHDARIAAEAKQGYVLLAEKTAAEAQSAELRRQLDAAQSATQSLQSQIQKDSVEDAQRDKDRESKITEYEMRLSQANRKCALSRDDISTIFHN